MSIDINYNINDNKQKGAMAVVYARYSSHKQGEQSIEGQLNAARIYAEGRGYTIIHEYIDRAVSGRTDNRDEFQQMLSDCAKKQFQVIIVWKVDRFGRNREEITFNKYRAKKSGVRVEYVAENLPDSPEAVILDALLEGMAEYYSLQLSQNIKRGYRENAKKCKYAGGHIPLGYKLDEDKHFIIDEQTAPTVRRIFSMYAEGYTIAEIAKQLNSEGLRTATGAEYSKNSFRNRLKNEKYVGTMDFKHGEIRVEGGVPAIVDRETFDKVQEMLHTNRSAAAHNWTKADYILTDKLFCGSCGSPMVGVSGKGKSGTKYSYYSCTGYRKKKCTHKPLRQDYIEKVVIDNTIALIMNDDLIDAITNAVWEYYEKESAQNDKLKSLQNKLADIDKAISNLMRAIEAGLPITNEITKHIEELNEQKTAINSAIAASTLEQGFKLEKSHIKYFLQRFQTADYKDRSIQKRLITTFINSIYVNDDNITINYNYSDNDNSRTLNLDDMARIEEIRESKVFDCRAFQSTKARAYEHSIILYGSVFAVKINLRGE